MYLDVKRMKGDEIAVFFRHIHGADHWFFALSHVSLISFLNIIPWFVFIEGWR
jgi:hypothetical protein